jgi:hypothetical protein
MITIFRDFDQFSVKKLAILLKQCYDYFLLNELLYFVPKAPFLTIVWAKILLKL